MEGKDITQRKNGSEELGAEYVAFYNGVLVSSDVSSLLEMTLADRIACEMRSYFDELEGTGALERIISTVCRLVDGRIK